MSHRPGLKHAGRTRATTKPLVCHPASPCVVECRPDAGVSIADAGRLRLRYSLAGEMSQLRIPDQRKPARVDGLWKQTCFEAFIRRAGEPGYLELNFSPSGEWAAYDFVAYREPASGAVAMPVPEVALQRTDGGLTLEAMIRIEERLTPGAVLQIGLSCVVEARDGSLSYWALRHPSDRPDFHHPDSFALEMAMDATAQT